MKILKIIFFYLLQNFTTPSELDSEEDLRLSLQNIPIYFTSKNITITETEYIPIENIEDILLITYLGTKTEIYDKINKKLRNNIHINSFEEEILNFRKLMNLFFFAKYDKKKINLIILKNILIYDELKNFLVENFDKDYKEERKWVEEVFSEENKESEEVEEVFSSLNELEENDEF